MQTLITSINEEYYPFWILRSSCEKNKVFFIIQHYMQWVTDIQMIAVSVKYSFKQSVVTFEFMHMLLLYIQNKTQTSVTEIRL